MFVEAVVCLALNVYWEARNQPLTGQIAVSQVVMNRMESEYYPDNVCEVITQGPTRPSWKNPLEEIPVRHRCQFSWYCDGKSDEPTDMQAWEQAIFVAHGVWYGKVDDQVDGSLWYHADYVTPAWASEKEIRAVHGNHIFYGWKGRE